jgi:hypothetical protein
MTEENTPGGDEPVRKRGAMRRQDAENTTPREPTLAEQRARRKALAEERDREIAEKQAREEAERKAATRRKVLIGGGATVGLVGMVAAWYITTPPQITATCVNADGIVAEDQRLCDEDYLREQGATYNPATGLWLMPMFLGGGQYRYNYGGTGAPGTKVSGGTFQRPSNASINTQSGKTIQRGGFGITNSGKSGGS